MPDLAEFARACETPPGARERADLASLPRQLKLEFQYALQRRRDDNTTKTRPHDICGVIKILAGSGATSLLMLEEQEWRRRSCAPAGETRQQAALLSYAYSEVCALAEGEGGWDSEYPRDTWRLRRLGITGTPFATLQFGGITQPWLKDLAKRWTRWRISTGLSITSCYHGLRAVTRFAGFAAHAGILEGALFFGLLVFFSICGLRLLVKKDIPAAILAALLLLLSEGGLFTSSNWKVMAAIHIGMYSVLLFVLLRLGLVATMAAVFFIDATNLITLGADWKTWYAPSGLATFLLLLGIAVFAFWRSLGTRELFSGKVAP